MARIEIGKVKLQDSNKIIHEFRTDNRGSKYFKNKRLEVSYPVDITDVDNSILSVSLTTYLSTLAWVTGSRLNISTLDSRMAAKLVMM